MDILICKGDDKCPGQIADKKESNIRYLTSAILRRDDLLSPRVGESESRGMEEGGRKARSFPDSPAHSLPDSYSSIFQKAMPPACLPISAVATRSIVCKSITSTEPGSPPMPSTETKA